MTGIPMGTLGNAASAAAQAAVRERISASPFAQLAGIGGAPATPGATPGVSQATLAARAASVANLVAPGASGGSPGGSPGAAGAASPATSPSARAALEYYRRRGLSPTHASGIVGNLEAESGFSNDVLSGKRRGDNGTAAYAGQWRGDRLTNLENFARSRGNATPSFEDQLEFVLHEAQTGSDQGAKKAFDLAKGARTPEEAADIYRTWYERPSADAKLGQHDARRTFARQVAGGQAPRGTPGAPAASGGPAAAPGVSSANAFLKTRLVGHGPDHVDGLQTAMQDRLGALYRSAPAGIAEGLGIYSGARSVDRQRELYAAALRKYGSPAEARKWVAPPGKSNHNHGQAVDVSWNGESLEKAPESVKKWVHDNAGQFGLAFPLANEPWHAEMVEARGAKWAGTLPDTPGGGTASASTSPGLFSPTAMADLGASQPTSPLLPLPRAASRQSPVASAAELPDASPVTRGGAAPGQANPLDSILAEISEKRSTAKLATLSRKDKISALIRLGEMRRTPGTPDGTPGTSGAPSA